MTMEQRQPHFQKVFSQLDAEPQGAAWLAPLRAQARERFAAMGLPNRRQEEWKYTSIAPLAETDFAWPQPASKVTPSDVIPGPFMKNIVAKDEISLIFVDGHLVFKELRGVARDATVESLAEAAEHGRPLLERALSESAELEGPAFTALNQSLLQRGAFIHIPRGTAISPLIHLVFVASDGSEPSLIAPRIIVWLEDQAQASVLQSFVGPNEATYFTDVVTDAFMGQGAHLGLYRLQAEGQAAFHVSHTRIRQARDAQLDAFDFSMGSRLCRNELDIRLEGAGAQAALNGLYFLRGRQHVDNHTTVDHRIANATSSQLYKGILDDQARGVFNGKILVRRDAQNTNAHQTNKTLLLSQDAEIDTKPELQIDADDVKCTHGAAIGQLNRDELFYLESRGIPRPIAEVMLSHAFADDVVFALADQRVRRKIGALLSGFFPE